MKPSQIISRFRGEFLNLNRLNGRPLPNKMRYLANAFVGETLRRRTIGTFGLRLVEISLTDKCQCRCRHCFAAKDTSESQQADMSTADIKEVLNELSAAGVTEICFSGGEPLLRDDILELVAYARQKQFVVRLITNGIRLDAKMVKDLKQAGLSWCSLSLDSPDPEKHDAFRDYPGCHKRAIEGLKLLVQHHIPCSIITVARKEIIRSGELEEIVVLGLELGVTAVRINFPVPIGRFKDDTGEVLSLEEREEVRKLLRYGIVTMESPREGTSCTAAVTKLNILPDGDVTPCVFVPFAYGNIRRNSFLEIWKAMEDYTREFKVKGQCPMCDDSVRARLFEVADLL